MTQSAVPQGSSERLFPEHSLPDSMARRRFRALARSAPWLSTSVRLELTIPQELAQAAFAGRIEVLLRGREAIAVSRAEGELVFQRELFTASRGRDYVAATASSWALPASLASPVYTDDHLVARRPPIDGFGSLLPQAYWAALLDPYELAGTEPAAHDLAFDHPTYIHELAQITTPDARPALAAVLSAGHRYQGSVTGFQLVPADTRTLIVLDLGTGICVERRVLDSVSEPMRLRVMAHDEYYIDSLFTVPHPTLTDVRAPIPWPISESG